MQIEDEVIPTNICAPTLLFLNTLGMINSEFGDKKADVGQKMKQYG